MTYHQTKIIRLFRTDTLSQTHNESTLTLEKEGVVGDKHYAKGLTRSILIASMDSYVLVKERLGIEMPYGYLGENILINGSIRELSPGDRLHIDSVILEITQNCTLCSHLGTLDKRIPALLKEDRGVFAKTVQGGTVSLADSVAIQKSR